MKITMLGRKGSGKTSFLGSLHDCFMARTSHGFSLKTKQMGNLMSNGNTKELRMMLGKLEELSIRENGFANATQETTLWLLELLYQDTTICDFQWIDYRGGAIDDSFRVGTGQKDSQDITAHIADSEAVIIFVDSIILSRFYPDMDDIKFYCGADRIYKFFTTMKEDFKNKNLVILFVLAKSDSNQLNPDLVKNNFEGLKNNCKKAFEEVIQLSKRSEWKVAIIPTGVVGSNKVKTTVNDDGKNINVFNEIIRAGSVSPMNIDFAIFYCIKNVLDFRKNELDINVEVLTDEIAFNLSKSGVLDDFWTLINNMVSTHKQESARKKAERIMEMRKAETEKLKKIEQDIKILAGKYKDAVVEL